MEIPRFFVNLGKVLINRAGIMTQRQMLAATTKVGRGIAEAAAKGDLSAELAGNIIRKALPKGVKAPDFITTSSKEAAEWSLRAGVFSDVEVSSIQRTFQSGQGAFTGDSKNLESLLYINPTYEISPNTVAHEFRHFLDATATLKSKISSFVKSIFPKFSKHKMKGNVIDIDWVAQQKYEQLEKSLFIRAGLYKIAENEKIFVAPTKAGLLEHMGVSEKELTSFLSEKINNLLTKVSRKDSIKILKELIKMMQTEVTAQHSGAKISRALMHIKRGESCSSDISAIFHNEFLQALKQALKEERKAYYKGMVGFKVPKRELVKIRFRSKVEYDPKASSSPSGIRPRVDYY